MTTIAADLDWWIAGPQLDDPDLDDADTIAALWEAATETQDREPIPALTPEAAVIFWSRVDRSGGPNACWPWTKARWGKTGEYGCVPVKRPNGTWRNVGAHRLAWFLATGEQPPLRRTHVLDHFRCNEPLCCNPAHLRVETDVTNVLRGDGVCAANARRTHCKHGHEFDAENTLLYVAQNGRTHRKCRTCDKLRRK